MDTPGWVYRGIYGQPGINALRRATLQFCGVSPVRVLRFGTVFNSTAPQRGHWIEKARAAGRALARGVPDRREAVVSKALSWVRAMRLQFYPMTWLAYTLGAGAAGGGSPVRAPGLWAGLPGGVPARIRRRAGKRIRRLRQRPAQPQLQPVQRRFARARRRRCFTELRYGLAFTLAAFAACGLLLFAAGGVPAATVGALGACGAVLCLGYTSPPL